MKLYLRLNENLEKDNTDLTKPVLEKKFSLLMDDVLSLM